MFTPGATGCISDLSLWDEATNGKATIRIVTADNGLDFLDSDFLHVNLLT
jgi:hypothetical protein